MPNNEEKTQLFEKTSIYKAAHFLLKETQRLVASMNRAYKYTAGTQILDATIDLATSIAEAYNEKDISSKIQLIDCASKRSQKVLILLRVAYDLQLINHQLYIECISACVDIIKQSKSWSNSLDKQQPSQNQNSNIRGSMS